MCAARELAVENAAMREENAAMKKQLAERDTRDAERDARLARLEQMVLARPELRATSRRITSTQTE
jgi:hypothetical protein